MQAEFWHEKWERGELGFHAPQPNELLTKYFERLNLTVGSRVLVPLCGKTLDIDWLMEQKCQVVGVELSEIAVRDLFERLDIHPEVSKRDSFVLYRSEQLDVFVGDIFNLSQQLVGRVNAIYDRAAYVALPLETRRLYASHLQKVTGSAPQLLITFEYDPSLINGPPFTISAEEIKANYQDGYSVSNLEKRLPEKKLRGVEVYEYIWLLR